LDVSESAASAEFSPCTPSAPQPNDLSIQTSGSCSRKRAFAATVILGYAFPKQAMGMTKCGSMESQEAGFPPFPHSLEIPSGLPHCHGLDCWRISKCSDAKTSTMNLIPIPMSALATRGCFVRTPIIKIVTSCTGLRLATAAPVR
jgi:hypothetical protein